MRLKEILQKIAKDKDPVLLSDGEKDWEAWALLKNLSEPMLKRQAYFQPGLYIAEISDAGFLGQVMYRIKQKA
jgi:hypothetical protein